MNPSIVESLRDFETFDGLSDDDLMVLAGRSSIKDLPKRSVLFRHGEDDPWIYCLAEGTLELVASDGRQRRIEAGTRAAGHPVAALRPRQYTATAVTPVRVISIDGNDLGNWHELLVNTAFEVEEMAGMEVLDEAAPIDMHDESLDHRERLLGGELQLPSLPTVALEARRVIDRDDSGIKLLAKIVLNDPPIAAKLVKAANSPVFYGRGNIETCERAIVRLGLKTTRQLVVAFAMRDLFRCESPQIQQRMQTLWQHSSEVAAIAYVMARRLKLGDADEAQLAGLVHDIGTVPILTYAALQQELVDDPDAVAKLDDELRASIGPRLLRTWNFPDGIIAAARDAEDWHRTGSEAPDLADLIVVAQIISYFGKPQSLAMPPLPRIPAFRKIFGENAGPEQISALLDEAQIEIEELQGLLRA